MNEQALKIENQNINNGTTKSFDFPDKKALLSLSYIEKLAHIDKLRIVYPKMKEITKVIQECMDISLITSRPQCMRISGKSGAGKSTYAEIFTEKYPSIETPTGKEIPVFHSSVPCPGYIGGLASNLLHDLGDPFWNRPGKITIHTNRLYKLLIACKVKLIFIDEVQQLVERNSQKLLRDSSDWFKQLIDATKIPVIFLGMPDSEKIFIENVQLANRVRYCEKITEFIYGKEFQMWLYYYDKSLPFYNDSGLYTKDMSKRIHIATNGLMKHIHDLIFEASKIALDNNASCITIAMFAMAYDKILFQSHEKNPFAPGYDL